MYQVSGIQTDAKEWIAKVAVYNVEQLAPWDADPNVFIPLNYSTEVGRDQLINVISDVRSKHRLVLNQETSTRVIAAPVA